jgi:hypothetical protein
MKAPVFGGSLIRIDSWIRLPSVIPRWRACDADGPQAISAELGRDGLCHQDRGGLAL